MSDNVAPLRCVVRRPCLTTKLLVSPLRFSIDKKSQFFLKKFKKILTIADKCSILRLQL